MMTWMKNRRAVFHSPPTSVLEMHPCRSSPCSPVMQGSTYVRWRMLGSTNGLTSPWRLLVRSFYCSFKVIYRYPGTFPIERFITLGYKYTDISWSGFIKSVSAFAFFLAKDRKQEELRELLCGKRTHLQHLLSKLSYDLIMQTRVIS